MDDFIKVMDAAMVQLCNYDRSINERRRDYGCKIEMTPREIHTLEAIHNHPELNATQLAESIGLQKGTFSKLARRLEGWDLIQRHQQGDNRKAVFFRVTELGRAAYDGHYRFHERTSPASYDYFHLYTEEQQAIILGFIDHYTQYLMDYLT